jgi:hypothetical protein
MSALIKFHPKQLVPIQSAFGTNIFQPGYADLPALEIPFGDTFNAHFLNNRDVTIDNVAAGVVKHFLDAGHSKAVVMFCLEMMYIDAANAKLNKWNLAPLEFLKWQIAEYGSYAIAFQQDIETIVVTKPPAAGMNATDYCNMYSLANAIVVAAGFQSSANGGLMSKNDPQTQTHNRAVSGITPKVVYANDYRQINDDTKFIAGDNVGNLAKLNTYFNTTLPLYIANFKALFPDARIVVTQWMIEDGAGTIVSGKPMGNLSIGLMAEHLMKNTANYAGIFWFRAEDLFHRGVESPILTSMKRVSKAITKYKYTSPVDISIPGVSGQAVTDGVNSWGLLLNNQNATETVLQPTDISIRHKSILGNIITNSGSAATWDSPQVDKIETLPTLPIHPNSVSFSSFTTI